MAEAPQLPGRPCAPSESPQREYDFVLSTGSKRTDAEARRTIRSRVMRTYVQEKTGQTQNMSFVNSDSALKAGTSSLKGRFRLKKPRERPEENNQITLPSRAHREPTLLEVTFPVHGADLLPPSTDSMPSPSLGGWQEAIMVPGDAVGGVVSTIPRYGAANIDPFNVLPVPGGPRLDRLLYYCKSPKHDERSRSKRSHDKDNSHCQVTSNAVNPTRTWYEFLASHNALFHALLSTVAMCAWKFAGFDTKPDMLYHYNQTLRKISYWLQSLESAPLEQVIAAICVITSSEVCLTQPILPRLGSLTSISVTPGQLRDCCDSHRSTKTYPLSIRRRRSNSKSQQARLTAAGSWLGVLSPLSYHSHNPILPR